MSTDNPLVRLKRFGQSVWLDYIRRDMLMNGVVARMIADDGLAGMASNPAIFIHRNSWPPAHRARAACGRELRQSNSLTRGNESC